MLRVSWRKLILEFLIALTLFILLIGVGRSEEWSWNNQAIGTYGDVGNLSNPVVKRVPNSSIVVSVWISAIGRHNYVIQLSKSIDGGRTFSTPTTVLTMANLRYIDLAIKDQNTYYIAYGTVEPHAKIGFIKTIDGGNNFVLSTLYTDPAGNIVSCYPQIIYNIGLDEIYIFYVNSDSLEGVALFQALSINGGNNFVISTLDAPITPSTPQISAYIAYSLGSDDRIAIAYSHNNFAKIKFSSDGGHSFATVTTPYKNITSGFSLCVGTKIAATDEIYLFYRSDPLGHLSSAFTTNPGVVWSSSLIVPTSKGGNIGDRVGFMSDCYYSGTSQDYALYTDDKGSRVLYTDNSWRNWNINTVSSGIFSSMSGINDTLDIIGMQNDNTLSVVYSNSVLFSSVPQTVQSVNGLGITNALNQFVRVKDASVGNQIANGLIPIAPYYFDGAKFNLGSQQPFKSISLLTGGTLTGNGVTNDIGFITSKMTCHITTGGTDPTSVTIKVFGSVDGLDFGEMSLNGTATTFTYIVASASTTNTFSTIHQPIRYIYGYYVSKVGGDATTGVYMNCVAGGN